MSAYITSELIWEEKNIILKALFKWQRQKYYNNNKSKRKAVF
jgi:hypothetical protein